ncbi:P-loop containing nucleoside triphosphate hydrolase protein [Scenedesmus sp. NREL 46B-D3]|nr:P-loop containing nucleoside triphosphate hydrolase protein [Scenedesmus sp. NREL 46B-D3]
MRAARAAVSRKLSRSRMLRMKIISLGDTGTGKSCLIKRYCEEKFISKYIPTIGVDYGVKPVHFAEHEVRVNLWDLAGPPAYLEVRNEFYKETQGALLVYDATSRPSFEAVGSWLQEAQRFGAPHNMVVFVAATKVDLPGRKVSEAEGRAWALAHNMPHFEVSAASGCGVKALFASLFAAVLAQLPGTDCELVATAGRDALAARQAEGMTAAASVPQTGNPVVERL